MKNLKWNVSIQWLFLLGALLLASAPGRAEEADGRADPAGQAVSRNEGSKAELYYYIEYKPANWQAQASIKVKSYNGTGFDEVDLGSGTATSPDEWLKTPVSKIENEIVTNHAYPLPDVTPSNVVTYRYRLIASPGNEVFNRVLDATGCFHLGSIVEKSASDSTKYEVVVVPTSRGGALPGKASKVSPGDGSLGMALGFLSNGQTAGFVELMPRLVDKKDFNSGDLVATYGRPLSAADLSCVNLTPEVEVINITVPEYNGQPATRGLRQVIAPQAVVDIQQDGFDLWVKFYLPNQKQSRLQSEPDAAGTGTIVYTVGNGPYTFSGTPFVTYKVQWSSTGWAKTSSGALYKVYECPTTFTITRTEGSDSKVVTLTNNEQLTISTGEADVIYQTCPECGGSGTVFGEVPCAMCGGLGYKTCSFCGGNGNCWTCGGSGGCSDCGGYGSQACDSCYGLGWSICSGCDGLGAVYNDCGDCGGTGTIPDEEAEDDPNATIDCPSCGGNGSRLETCSSCGGSGHDVCETCSATGRTTCATCGGSGECNGCWGTGYCSWCDGAGLSQCGFCLETGGTPDTVICGNCGGSGQEVIDVIYPPTYVNSTDTSLVVGFGSSTTQTVSTTTRYEQDGTPSSQYDYTNQFNSTVRVASDASLVSSVYEGKFPAYRREVVDTWAGNFGIYDISDGTQKLKTAKRGTVEPQSFFGYYRLAANDSFYTSHHGRAKWQLEADGSWAMMDYETDLTGLGQITRVISPFNDSTMPSWSSALQSWVLTETGSEVAGDDYDLTMPSRIPDGSSLAGKRVITTTYTTDWQGLKRLPDTVTTTADGKQVGFVDYDYIFTQTANDQPLMVTTKKTYTSAGNFLTSVTKVYDGANVAPWLRGLSYSSQDADGSKESNAYHRGTYDATSKTFTKSSTGSGFRAVTLNGRASSSSGSIAVSSYDGATIDTVYMIPNVSTAEVTLRDDRAFTMRSETLLYTGSGWTLIDSVDMQYDNYGNLTRRQKFNGALYEATYVNGRKDTEKDEQGLTTTFHYDDDGRVDYTIRSAIGSDVPALRTSFTYDVEGRLLSTTSGDTAGEKIISSKAYDKSGRVTTETNEGLTTEYIYVVDSNNLIKSTIKMPGGAERIIENYRDGRPKSVTGTAGIAEYYHYSINDSGQEVVTKYIGANNGPRWTRTYTDWAGRDVKTESTTVDAAGAAATLEATSIYNDLGQLASTQIEGLAPTVYSYDGNGVRTGTTRADRKTTVDYGIRTAGSSAENYVWERYGGDTTTLWDYAESRAYPNNANDSVIENRVWTRLTNFDRVSGSSGVSGTAIAEVVSADANGNRTVTQTFLDRSKAKVTIVVWSPFAAEPSITISVAGRLVSQTSSAGVAVTYGYDELGRGTSATDRTGTSRMTYHSGSTRTRTVVDSLGVTQHTYSYDAAGRIKQDQTPRIVNGVVSGTNNTYYAYNTRNQITHVWGDVSYPVKHVYNNYGDRTDLYTYRNTNFDWSVDDLPSSGWPSDAGEKTSSTHFDYYEPTGLLWKKTDASNKTITYTYNTRGQVQTRKWARGTITTYKYYDTAEVAVGSATGELKSVSYADTTPALSYTYDRLGRMKTVTDATGTRTFAYRDIAESGHAADMQLESETFGWPDTSATRRITTQYDPATGRFAGYSLENNGSSEHSLAFGYDAASGRLNTITSGAGDFRYGYLAQSSLISSVARGSFIQTRGYEAGRNILNGLTSSSLVGTPSAYTVANYTYVCDALGRRTSVNQSGQVYRAYTNDTQVMSTVFGYNNRDEVISSKTSVNGTELPGRSFGYAFDSIGNRTQDKLDNATNSYESNKLNQYTGRATPGFLPITGTANRTGGATVSIDGTNVTNWTNDYFYYGVNKNGATSAYGQTFNFSATASGASQSETVWTAVRPVSESFGYDDDGNLTSDSLWIYRYDGENRLIEMTAKIAQNPSQPQALRFRYDYMDRRVAKEVYTYTGTAEVPTGYTLQSKTYFAWNGWTLIGEYNANLALARRYTFGIDLSGNLGGAGDVGGLLAIEDKLSASTAGVYLPAFDGNGNVTGLADGATGALAAAYEYDPSGNILRATGTYAKQNPFRFAGKYYDLETGLSYYGYRYYCASTGRFINRDPIEEAGGLNMYAMSGNDTVNRWDLLGLTEPVTVLDPFVVNGTRPSGGGGGQYNIPYGYTWNFDPFSFNTDRFYNIGQHIPISGKGTFLVLDILPNGAYVAVKFDPSIALRDDMAKEANAALAGMKQELHDQITEQNAEMVDQGCPGMALPPKADATPPAEAEKPQSTIRKIAGWVPVVGSVLDAIDSGKKGNYGMMALNIALAISDLSGTGAIVKGLAVGTMKFAARKAIKNVYKKAASWNEMRAGLQKIGQVAKNKMTTPRKDWLTTDHIFFKQRGNWPHWLVNHPANLQTGVTQSLNSSFEHMGVLQRAAYLPTWMKVGATGVATSGIGLAVGSGSEGDTENSH